MHNLKTNYYKLIIINLSSQTLDIVYIFVNSLLEHFFAGCLWQETRSCRNRVATPVEMLQTLRQPFDDKTEWQHVYMWV